MEIGGVQETGFGEDRGEYRRLSLVRSGEYRRLSLVEIGGVQETGFGGDRTSTGD